MPYRLNYRLAYIIFFLSHLKSDYLTYCNPSYYLQNKSQAIKPTVYYKRSLLYN